MAIKNQALVVVFQVWDTSTDSPKTGDNNNLTLRLVQDGSIVTPTNSSSEISSTYLPGLYKITLTASEMNYSSITLGGKSTTLNVIVYPVNIITEIGNATGSIEYTDIVIDDQDDPIEDAEIECYSDSGYNNLVDIKTTDVNGSFTFNLNSGTYYFRAIKSGYDFDNWSYTVV